MISNVLAKDKAFDPYEHRDYTQSLLSPPSPEKSPTLMSSNCLYQQCNATIITPALVEVLVLVVITTDICYLSYGKLGREKNAINGWDRG